MIFKCPPNMSRRGFLISMGSVSVCSMLPFWNANGLGPDIPDTEGLFAHDFIWRCSDPSADVTEAFFHTGPCDGRGEWAQYPIDQADLTFDASCRKNFLVRRIIALGAGEVDIEPEELDSSLSSQGNKTTSFRCPSCGIGFWLGSSASGFEDRFRFAEGGHLQASISGIKTLSPIGTFVRNDAPRVLSEIGINNNIHFLASDML